MATFLYYIPGGSRAISLDDLRKLGLGYAFDVKPAACEIMAHGPDGGQGVIVADDTRLKGHKFGNYPDKQTWRQIPGCTAWIGYYTDAKPTPADLARPEQLTGHLVLLGDDRAWHVPVARGYVEEQGDLRWRQAVPKVTGLDDAGKWIEDGTVAKYEELWELALKWFDAIYGAIVDQEENDEDSKDEDLTFAFEGLNDSALLALATNYRLSKIEVAILGLFTSENVLKILDALIDRPTLQAWSKKKAAADATLNSPNGPADSTEGIGQP